MRAKKISNNRRYYLHRKLKDIYVVEARKRLIHVPPGPLFKAEVINELINAGYSAQLFIN